MEKVKQDKVKVFQKQVLGFYHIFNSWKRAFETFFSNCAVYCSTSPAVWVFLEEEGVALLFLGIILCWKLLLPYQDLCDKSGDPFPPSDITARGGCSVPSSWHKQQNCKTSNGNLGLGLVEGPKSHFLVLSALNANMNTKTRLSLIQILADALHEPSLLVGFGSFSSFVFILDKAHTGFSSLPNPLKAPWWTKLCWH